MSARQDTKSHGIPAASGGRGEAGQAVEHRNGGDNVDKIRELLFGEQMVGYESRFAALEARLVAEVESLRRSVEDGLAEVRAHFEKRADEAEGRSVPRNQLADSLEKLVEKLRG